MNASDPETWSRGVGLDGRGVAKMKILIVDDEPVNVALLEELLSEAGYDRFQSTTDSRLVTQIRREFRPDIVLLDLMMPHIDGFAVLELLRADLEELFLPVIVLTADINEETKRRALHLGATDFLLKPFDRIEALLRIANLLEMRRLHLLLDNQRAAFEEAVHSRSLELRQAQAELNNGRNS